MLTEEIVKSLKLTALLMDLHDENSFKVKSLNNAVFKLDKSGINLDGLAMEQLEKIDGIGKGISQKINELQTTGELKELNNFLSITPKGVIEMLSIKGIGAKKVRQLWKELEVETVGELLYACYENRLIDLKGFGTKTQEQVKKAIEFKMANAGKYHYASLEEYALGLVEKIKTELNTAYVSLTGEIRRKCEIIDKIEILVGSDKTIDIPAIQEMTVPVKIITCTENEFYTKLFETTGSEEHFKSLSPAPSTGSGQALSKGEGGKQISEILNENFTSEEEIYNALGIQYIEPELREGLNEVELARNNKIPKLIEGKDLKGILHNHTTYSDGLHTLKEMAYYCKELGYEYLGICDHSQSAFYAKGLKPEKVFEQQKEIDALNIELAPFKIFKGIESDILYDGSLDYPEEILKTFDFIVASIHSILKMDIDKATLRLIKAIENPYTTILGHPTGRLLLSRAGYPIDHKKIIDACAANNVVIELNAHPWRLDIDWRWIPYCMEKGVKISINPDAHEKEGYHDMHYGVIVARKGILTKEMCFNSLSREEIQKYFNT